MAATSTPLVSLLAAKIIGDHQDIHFVLGEDFAWSFATGTITHPEIKTLDELQQLLHEIGHARLKHSSYGQDVELIDMEREAWRYACEVLAPDYGIDLSVDNDIVQESLDSYRQWLYARSSCPECQAVGIEIRPRHYRCLHCQHQWLVNEARLCRLKRMSLKNNLAK